MKLFYKIFFILANLLCPILSYGSQKVSYNAEDYDDTKDLKNCLVIIVGCAKYKNGKDLPGCKEDIKMMKRVFQEEYGYKVISTDEENSKCKVTIKDFVKFMRRIDDEAGKHIEKKVLEYEKGRALYKKYTYYSKKIQNLKNKGHNVYSDSVQELEEERNKKLNFIETTYKCKQDTLKESKIDARKKLVENKDKYDSVIFIFTGHGYLNTISLYEKEVYIKTIINFLARAFQDKPKIVMLFSCAGEKTGTYKGENDSNYIGQDEIEADQSYLQNFYIIRSAVDNYKSMCLAEGSVTVLHLKDLLLDNIPTKNQKQDIDLGRLKRVLQKVVIEKKNEKGTITHDIETVNVSMDTMLQRVFLIPKEEKDMVKKIGQGSSEKKSDTNNNEDEERKYSSEEELVASETSSSFSDTNNAESKEEIDSLNKKIDDKNEEIIRLLKEGKENRDKTIKDQKEAIARLEKQVKLILGVVVIGGLVAAVIFILPDLIKTIIKNNHKHRT